MRINLDTLLSVRTHPSDEDGLQRRSPRLNDLRGRENWVGGCDAEYTVWKI